LRRLGWIASIANRTNTTLAISRSEIDNWPDEFCSVFMFAWLSGGHSTQNTVGRHDATLFTMIPPASYLDTSFIPTKSAGPCTCCLRSVGCFTDSWSSVRILTIASNRAGFLCNATACGRCFSDQLQGDRSALPGDEGVSKFCYNAFKFFERDGLIR